MRVLLVDAYHPDDPDRRVATVARDELDRRHEVEVTRLVAEGFTAAMSPAERAAYHEAGANLLVDETRLAAARVSVADALLFCYPTVAFNVPAVLKAWLERVLVPGVAFGFDDRGRVTRGLTRVVRLGALTTRPHGAIETARSRDGGRRTITRTLRLDCAPRCRRTFVALRSGSVDEVRVRRAVARW